ncbi:MAG: hypothetical protein RSJ40_06625, partial [Acetivibrio sp.]
MGLKKAILKVEAGKDITVMFNPSEYNLTETTNYSEKGGVGLDGKIAQFISGENSTLAMTLYFDTFIPPSKKMGEGGTDVSKLTKEIGSLTYIVKSLHRPPMVTFIWGPLRFCGMVTNVAQQFTMFLGSGVPVRAKVEITLKSVFDIKKSQRKSPFESPDRTKFRTIHEGEQLWNFAWEEYGDAGLWRVIASENHILNPLDIYPGQ